MMTRRLTCALSLLLGLAGAQASCASRGDDEPREPAAAAALEENGGKARAPVELELVACGSPDALTLTLRVRTTNAIPRAVARFVLPDGVVVVSGEVEQELGALSDGETREASIVVRAPAARAVLGGGVDCHMHPGVKLYRATQLELGVEVPTPDPRRPGLEREGLRATPARPR
jgi:hypothetical protein